jgi:protein Mpv17
MMMSSSLDTTTDGGGDLATRPDTTLYAAHEPSSTTTTRTTTTTTTTTTAQGRNPWFDVQEFKTTTVNVNHQVIIHLGILLAIGVLVVCVKWWCTTTTMDAHVARGWWTAEEAALLRIPLHYVWASYSEVLERAPVMTKAVTSATVYTIGDVIAQRTEGTTGDLDRLRTLRSMLAGLLGHGPLSHYWYNFCDQLFDNTLQWTAWWAFFPKILVDQTTWGPFWNNSYILLLGLMKLEKPSVIFADMKRTTIPLIVSGLKLWPLAHCVTYGLVPTENRVLWVDLVEILWVTILATQASGAASPEAAADAAETNGTNVALVTLESDLFVPPSKDSSSA